MVERRLWLDLIESAWRARSIVWLVGVRRVGKTVLARSLPRVEYFDCELPRTRRLMDDPEAFLTERAGSRIVLDEVHRLPNPAELLKIAADHYPTTRILATGSSTLGASRRFRDTLAGRKRELHLTPLLVAELAAFGHAGELERRLHRGGLPEHFLAEAPPERDFQEWMDAYWARDLQELFRLERRHAFQRLTELLFARSGGIFEATAYARPCEVSRQTISNYLAILEATHVAHVVRPFSTHRPTEIVSAPKVYGFDTGFVCHHRGWTELRHEDRGILWEHVVLNEIIAELQTRDVRYWRDKSRHEIDFVLERPGAAPVAIECKWALSDFNPAAFVSFRKQYPNGPSLVVSTDVDRPFTRSHGGVKTSYVGLRDLIDEIRPDGAESR